MALLKPISALGGICLLLMLAQGLPAADYGVYFSFWALIEISVLVSNFGAFHAVYRYVHASVDRETGRLKVFGPLGVIACYRIGTLILVACGVHWLTPGLAEWLGVPLLAKYSVALAWVVLFEGGARFVETVFDAMLEQARTQFSTLFRAISKLLLVAALVLSDRLSIDAVVWVEAMVAVMGFLMAIFLFWRVPRERSSHAHEDDFPGWRVAAGFLFPAFAAQVLGVFYGPDILKMVLGAHAGVEQVAVFGFCYAMAAVVQRYLPANILAGMFRPVFVAAARQQGQLLSTVFAVVVKVNMIFVLAALSATVLIKDSLLEQVAAGAYSKDGWVLVSLMLCMLPIALHACVSMLCLAMGTSWAPLGATFLAATCAFGAPALASDHGAVGVTWLLLVAESVWCCSCIALLVWGGLWPRASGWLRYGANALMCAALVLLGLMGQEMGGAPWLISALVPVVYIACSLRFGLFSSDEAQKMLSVMPGGHRLRRWMGLS